MPGAGPPAVLLGGTANAVSVARSLAEDGVRVVALGDAFVFRLRDPAPTIAFHRAALGRLARRRLGGRRPAGVTDPS